MVESGSDPRAKGPVRSLLSTTDTSVNKIKMWNSVFPITRIIREQRTETKQPSLILEHSRVGQWICYVYMFVGGYTYMCEIYVKYVYSHISHIICVFHMHWYIHLVGVHACIYLQNHTQVSNFINSIHIDIDFSLIFACPSKKVLVLKTS